jgi:restriction system protein
MSETRILDYATDCHKLVIEFVIKYSSRWSERDVQYLTAVFKQRPLPEKSRSIVFDDLQNAVSECLKQMSLLQQLLAAKGWRSSDEEIFRLVQHEGREMLINEGKQRILRANPIGRDELLRAYVNISNSDDEVMMESLSRIIREKNFGLSSFSLKPEDAFFQFSNLPVTTVPLKAEVAELEKSIALQAFEKNLLRDASVLPPQIDAMSGRDFEVFIATLFQKMGFDVEQTKLTGDQGADVIVSKRGEKIAIQAKRSSARVGNRAVQEVMGSVSIYKALRGIVITNSFFTRSAIELAAANKIELIDKTRLSELIQIYW